MSTQGSCGTKMPLWEAAFCVVAKVPGVGNKVTVSTFTAIRGESWCNSTYACVFPLCACVPRDTDFLMEHRTVMKVDGHVTSQLPTEMKISLVGLKPSACIMPS